MVENCFVVVADGTRARFLTLEEAAAPEIESSPYLIERKDLLNPESDAKGRDLWTDVKSGLGRESSGAPTHSYDDHRDQHEDEFQRRFAERIVEEALAFVHTRRADRVIIAAEKQMLGFLRPALAHTFKSEVEVRELAKNLSRLSPTELQDRLAKEGLLPPRRPPGFQPGRASSGV